MSDSGFVQIIVSIAAVTVSAAVACFSYHQWQIAEQKLRLDLYNRRFAIYEKIVSFYRHYILSASWDGFTKEQQDRMTTELTLATRESRFLFNADDGVLAALEKFTNEVNGTRSQILEGILESVEDKMSPYLNFHSITVSPSRSCISQFFAWAKQTFIRA